VVIAMDVGEPDGGADVNVDGSNGSIEEAIVVVVVGVIVVG